jgi:hypothetical protein
MKVIVSSLLLSSMASAAQLPQSRRLDQNNQEDYSFLQNYEQVFVKCLKGEKSQNEEGNWEYSSVAYRLCPTGSACDAKGHVCSEGYGDFVVGIETYTKSYFEQFERDNGEQQNADDANDFDFMEFGECRELDYEGNDDGVQYYVGPGCTDNGDVKLTLYTDEYCRPAYEVTETSFEDLTGFQLPYSNGIHSMEDGACKAYYCYGQNENGEYEINEFCQNAYAAAGSKCEEQMEYSGYSGQINSGCDYIHSLMPASTGGGGGGMWFLFALLIAAVAGFGIWFFLSNKKKQSTAVNSDGLMM